MLTRFTTDSKKYQISSTQNQTRKFQSHFSSASSEQHWNAFQRAISFLRICSCRELCAVLLIVLPCDTRSLSGCRELPHSIPGCICIPAVPSGWRCIWMSLLERPPHRPQLRHVLVSAARPGFGVADRAVRLSSAAVDDWTRSSDRVFLERCSAEITYYKHTYINIYIIHIWYS